MAREKVMVILENNKTGVYKRLEENRKNCAGHE